MAEVDYISIYSISNPANPPIGDFALSYVPYGTVGQALSHIGPYVPTTVASLEGFADFDDSTLYQAYLAFSGSSTVITPSLYSKDKIFAGSSYETDSICFHSSTVQGPIFNNDQVVAFWAKDGNIYYSTFLKSETPPETGTSIGTAPNLNGWGMFFISDENYVNPPVTQRIAKIVFPNIRFRYLYTTGAKINDTSYGNVLALDEDLGVDGVTALFGYKSDGSARIGVQRLGEYYRLNIYNVPSTDNIYVSAGTLSGTTRSVGTQFDPTSQAAINAGFDAGPGYILPDNDIEPEPTSPVNPYLPGGSSTGNPGAGTGTWTLPSEMANNSWSDMDSTQTGLFRAYAMTLAQVQAFGSALWSAGILDTIAKYFDNPTDVIMGCIEYPFNITNVSADAEITFNWIPSWANPLNVTGAKLNSEYVQVQFGALSIPRYSGMFYDFQPYTTAQVYLPYIGFVPVKYSEIVGNAIALTYTISLTSGAAVATLVSGKTGVIGTYNCSIGRQLPMSARDLSGLYMTIAKAAVTGIAAAATAGAGLAAAGATGAGLAASEAANVGSLGYVGSSANLPVAVNDMSYMEAANNSFEFAKGVNMASNTIRNYNQSALNGAMNANGPIQRSGTMDAISARCAKQEAFILISIPHQNMPDNYANLVGFPSNVGGVVQNFSGYCEFRSVQLQTVGATADEIKEIESILKAGIYA